MLFNPNSSSRRKSYVVAGSAEGANTASVLVEPTRFDLLRHTGEASPASPIIAVERRPLSREEMPSPGRMFSESSALVRLTRTFRGHMLTLAEMAAGVAVALLGAILLTGAMLVIGGAILVASARR